MSARPGVAALLAVALVGCGGHGFVSRPADPPRAVVLRGVRVFDAPRAAVLPGLRDVVVRDGRVAEVAAPGVAAAGAVEIDGRGGTLLPGLVDLHTHTGAGASPPWRTELPNADENLGAWLYAGVTTVVDSGALTPAIFALRDRIRSGATLGPHLWAAGPIFTAPGGHPVGLMRRNMPWWARWYVIPRATREVGSPDAARAAVAELLDQRPDFLKITIDRVDPPALATDVAAAVVAAGHAAGVRSVAHVGNSADVLAAVEAGVDALWHAPYTEVIGAAALDAVGTKHVPVVPTVAGFDAVGVLGTRREFLPLERAIAPPALLASLTEVPAGVDAQAVRDELAAIAAARLARRRNVVLLRAAGATILVGSDAANPGNLPGAGFHAELAALVDAGMPAAEVLRAATWSNARFLAGDGADFGTIAPGQRADLVLVEGDPLTTIADTERIVAVLLDGVPLERHART